MARNPLTGTRIREKRMDLGLRQADLALDVGISPSYLNLIEHNKRRIGGKLLADLARSLDVEPATLTDGADVALLDQLRSVAADVGVTAEIDRAEELATRYPGWAKVIAALGDRAARLEAHVQTLNDRMSHDPQLATALHDVISAVTSIRSTASILVGDDKIDADWQRRFHQNIHDESLRLAAESEALVSYLDAPKTKGTPGLTAAEACEAMFAQHDHVFPTLESGGNAKAVDALVAKADLPATVAEMLRGQLTDYAALAAKMPMDDFAAAAESCRYDPAALAQRFAASLPQVFRRMRSLQTADGHPPMGWVTCDAAGVITGYKAVPGFALPRTGAACPLWPLYSALTQPGRPIRALVTMPDANETRLLCYAVAQQGAQAGFDQPPVYTAAMLVLPDPAAIDAVAQPVGITCRICPRANCMARREPSVLTAQKG